VSPADWAEDAMSAVVIRMDRYKRSAAMGLEKARRRVAAELISDLERIYQRNKAAAGIACHQMILDARAKATGREETSPT
jgi:hypothetical protein